MKKYTLPILGISFLMLVGTFLGLEQRSYALSGSQFQAGRIIDDSVFFSSGTMSANDIQQFLNAKVPVCDTNGTQMRGGMTRAAYGASQGNPAPFVCLKDYVQTIPARSVEPGLCNGIGAGTKSAAQIIAEVSVSCGINPAVLIVLLQKEQGLVTDDWPWNIQYRAATGFGCPDTAPCDSEFYGFFNQVYAAARVYKFYAKNPTLYGYRSGRTNSILFNPNASCGSSGVFIQNQATAGLYIYTPYQPNAAALNNLYGIGDACSAYGNRNFWRLFNDWFGPTVGPLVRSTTSPELFYSDGSYKYRVGSMEMASEYGLGLADVRIIAPAELELLETPPAPSTANLSLVVKSTSDSDEDGGNIYLISAGRRHLINSLTTFVDFGFSLSDLGYMPLGQLQRMPLAGTLSNYVKRSDGFVYQVLSNRRRGIFSGQTLQNLNPSGNITSLTDFVLNRIPVGPILTESTLVMRGSDGRLWLVTQDGWRHITSMQAFDCLGVATLGTVSFTDSKSTIGTQLGAASCMIQAAGGLRFIADGDRRIPIDNAWGITTFSDVDTTLANRLPVYNTTSKPVFRTRTNGELYVLENGKKRQIINMTSFTANGHTPNDIFTATTDFLTTIPTGTFKLADGMIVRDTADGALYVISGSTKIRIPTMELFTSYGFSTTAIINLPPQQLTDYTTNGFIQKVSRSTQSTFHDNATRWIVTSPNEVHFGISGTTVTYPAAMLQFTNTTTKPATRFIKFASSPMLYYLENGIKRPVYSWDLFVSLGGSIDSLMILSDASAAYFPTGPAM